MPGTVEALSFFQVTNRLARLIKQLPVEQFERSKEARLTQDALAARLGTVGEVMARSLRELEMSGALQVARGRIQVIDHERLLERMQIALEMTKKGAALMECSSFYLIL